MKAKIIFLFFVLFSVSSLLATEVSAKRMASAVLANLSQGDCSGSNKFIEENWQALEKVIFELAPIDHRYFGARCNALNYLAILCRKGKISQEVFFDIGCRAIKYCVFSKGDPKDLQPEVGAYRRIIGGFGYFPGMERLPFLKNLQAFFIFLQGLKKHGLLLTLKDFSFIHSNMLEVQTLLEGRKVERKDLALSLLRDIAAEISSYSKEIIDPNAKSVTLQYIEGLITQTKVLKIE